MNSLGLILCVTVSTLCSIAGIIFLYLKSRAEKGFREGLQGEMQIIRTDAGVAIESTRKEFKELVDSFQHALSKSLEQVMGAHRQSQEKADISYLEFRKQIDAAMAEFTQSFSSHLESIRTNEAKGLDEIREVIDTKLKIATEKMMEEGYKVQKERLALSTQKAHFLQFSETLDVVSRTISSAAESLTAASKRGRDITEKLVKEDGGPSRPISVGDAPANELAPDREKRKVA